MEGFIFRMGELHVVFTVLKVLGKIINNSGLDLSFEEYMDLEYMDLRYCTR